MNNDSIGLPNVNKNGFQAAFEVFHPQNRKHRHDKETETNSSSEVVVQKQSPREFGLYTLSLKGILFLTTTSNRQQLDGPRCNCCDQSITASSIPKVYTPLFHAYMFFIIQYLLGTNLTFKALDFMRTYIDEHKGRTIYFYVKGVPKEEYHKYVDSVPSIYRYNIENYEPR